MRSALQLLVLAYTSPLILFLLNLEVGTASPVQGSGSYGSQQLVFPSSPSSTVIPAFPEQSDIAGPCPLDLPDELFSSISRACSGLLESSSSTTATSSPSPTTRLRCCPSLAAWLYAAHASAALQSTRIIPSSTPPSFSSPSRTTDLPVLPDDSEACSETAEKELKSRGVGLARANETCGAVYCHCGIRLRPLSCPGGILAEKVDGKWVAADESGRRIERECDAGGGVEGCSRCLRSLYQLNRTSSGNHSSTGKGGHPGAGAGAGGDCELMGLTWLLASNRTRYLPVVTRVLRTLMFAPTGASPPASCSESFPMAVGSAVLYDEDLEPQTSSATGHDHHRFQLLLLLLLIWTCLAADLRLMSRL